ncbi:phosphohydrolase [Candidatus Magnetaquicoccus inordinatus]|uniref:phosphohydrolase n=1 Tax=Candidatus Magnetaquicoccus inordinatus TaxID=2496818 RepID=UPI00102AE5F5|nr:phosphohydrolase [Candidatus Magnetaquicoccus inordinatus]
MSFSAQEQRKGSWIQTFTGIQFWPLDARVQEVEIIDIAHSLSMLCRFNGHCRSFYSVAEHSVHVSRVVDPTLARWGLLHDAAEAYLSDLPQPIKQQMPLFRSHEESLLKIIAQRFALLPSEPPEAIKEADMLLLATEKAALMGREPAPWQGLPEPLPPSLIAAWSPEQAKEIFLQRFHELFF